ncbi:MAG TPA: hypothetical protein VGK52_07750 [Polyangia bacterium]|jgi:hypothetical protein
MSRNVVAALGALAVGLGVLAATTQGCGGGGSAAGGSHADVCNRFCDKQVACNNVPSGYGPECKSSCSAAGVMAATTNCPGLTAEQVVTMTDACLAKSCADLNGCFAASCPVTSGSAGAAGSADGGQDGAAGAGSAGATGGAGAGGAGAGGAGGVGGAAGAAGAGAAGTAGSGCVTTCAKADACCQALKSLGGSNCSTSSDCTVNTAQTESQCNGVLQAAALLGQFRPAACK